MPVQRQGQFVSTSPEDLNNWMGKESGKPVHIAAESTDLSAELKRGLSYVRNEKQSKNSAPQKKAKSKSKAREREGDHHVR